MDGRSASKITGLTYRQLNHYVNRVDGLLSRPSESQGKDRVFCYRDIVLLRLLNYLIADGFRVKQIRQAVNAVLDNWHNAENPFEAGYLFYGIDGFRWSPTTVYQLSSNGVNMPLESLSHIPKIFYNVRKIAREYSDIEQLEFDTMQTGQV